jgi:FkbM family methyltransferase
MLPPLSYAQRFEDFHLWRCFGAQQSGFYIDVGAGHPVFDNVSFAFYLQGWRGITVEPNPALAALSRAVRPRDHQHQVLCGIAAGETTFYLQREFHGLSTGIAEIALKAEREVGRTPEEIVLPVTTVKALCEQHAPAQIDFLKVDVEGGEEGVLFGAEWRRFRPKVVVVEAIEPFTFKPSHGEWEPLLTAADYRFAWTDDLNRYYVAEEFSELTGRLAAGPTWYDNAPQIGNFKPAADDPAHPDHRLARLLAAADLAQLPLLDRALLFDMLTGGLSAAQLAGTATDADMATALNRLFGAIPAPQQIANLTATGRETIRQLYRQIIDSDAFRAACGRIAASYAW